MALSPIASAPAGAAIVDTLSSVFGYEGPLVHARHHMPFEGLGGVGVASVTDVAMAVASSIDLPFVVFERDSAGVETAVQTGLLLAGTLQDSSGGLSLNPPNFAVSAVNATYAVRIDFPETASALVPGALALTGVVDGEGFVATIALALV